MHTVGTDIPQGLQACAAITAGKDNVLRDYTQGAWRMRGIGAGQTVRLLVSAQLERLVAAELPGGGGAAGKPAAAPRSPRADAAALAVDVLAWLVIAAIKSETGQVTTLTLQDVGAVWRTRALASLRASRAPPTKEAGKPFISRFECRADALTLESAHPYRKGTKEKRRIKIDGAKSIKIEFDARTDLHKFDHVGFLDEKEQSLPGMTSFSGGGGSHFKGFEIQGDTFVLDFYSMSEKGNPMTKYWGYRVKAWPSYAGALAAEVAKEKESAAEHARALDVFTDAVDVLAPDELEPDRTLAERIDAAIAAARDKDAPSAAFVDAAAMKELEAIAKKAAGGGAAAASTADDAGGGGGLDTEQQRENENEEEQENEQEQEQTNQIAPPADTRPEEGWTLAALGEAVARARDDATAADALAGALAGATPLERHAVGGAGAGTPTLPFPRRLLLSPNAHAAHDVAGDAASTRLKDVSCVLRVVTPASAGACVALSLAEAESLSRYLFHAAADRAAVGGAPLAQLALTDGTVLASSTGGGGDDDAIDDLGGLSALRFFNCETHFTPPQLAELRNALPRCTAAQAHAYFEALARSRRRPLNAWEGTPLAELWH